MAVWMDNTCMTHAEAQKDNMDARSGKYNVLIWEDGLAIPALRHLEKDTAKRLAVEINKNLKHDK